MSWNGWRSRRRPIRSDRETSHLLSAPLPSTPHLPNRRCSTGFSSRVFGLLHIHARWLKKSVSVAFDEWSEFHVLVTSHRSCDDWQVSLGLAARRESIRLGALLWKWTVSIQVDRVCRVGACKQRGLFIYLQLSLATTTRANTNLVKSDTISHFLIIWVQKTNNVWYFLMFWCKLQNSFWSLMPLCFKSQLKVDKNKMKCFSRALI